MQTPDAIAHLVEYGEHDCTHSVRAPVFKSYEPGEINSFFDSVRGATSESTA
jgi:hypothetical protein